MIKVLFVFILSVSVNFGTKQGGFPRWFQQISAFPEHPKSACPTHTHHSTSLINFQFVPGIATRIEMIKCFMNLPRRPGVQSRKYGSCTSDLPFKSIHSWLLRQCTEAESFITFAVKLMQNNFASLNLLQIFWIFNPKHFIFVRRTQFIILGVLWPQGWLVFRLFHRTLQTSAFYAPF